MATSGYSSCTDSQLFCGSQFWPENSQSTSQEVSLSSSSQEASDPKFSSSYQTKPLLFGELKGKTRGFGILEKFEEERRKAKENNDSNLLAKEYERTKETLNNIQQLVAGTERNMTVCQTVLEKFDSFASTLQNNLNGLQNDMSQHFEALVDKVNSHKKATTELQENVKKSADVTAELGANLQILKSSLESLKEEQERERNMLEEALKLLSTLVQQHSAKPSSQSLTDDAIQVSLGPEESLSLNNELESTQHTCTSHHLEQKEVEAQPPQPSCSSGKKKRTTKAQRKRKKRPLVLSRRSKSTAVDENSPSLMMMNKLPKVSSPLRENCDVNTVTPGNSLNPDHLSKPHREKKTSGRGQGSVITPLTCWSQDSNSSAGLPGIEPILEKMSAESLMRSPVKPEGFWQLFNMDYDSDFDF